MVQNLVILVTIAVLLGGFSLFGFLWLQRQQRRAPWKGDAGIRNSRRLERRAFVIAVGVVLALLAGLVAVRVTRRASCTEGIIIVTAPDGTKLECVCEGGRPDACFDPGP